MKKVIPCLLLLAAGPVFAQAHDEGTSKESAYYTYQQQIGDIMLMVDGQAAYYSAEEPFIPVYLAVANYKGEPLKIMLESFTLTDSAGHAVTPASLEEIKNGYKRLEEDKNLLLEEPMNTSGQFSTLSQVSSAFYPVTQSPRLATEGLDLPGGTWWQDEIYFPMPSTGLEGVLTLTVKPAGMDDSVSVLFRVPEKKEKDKDKDKH